MKKYLFLIIFVLLFPMFVQAQSLSGRMKGKILLQVEANGEAWYVNPGDGLRYYMGRPEDAFDLMRGFGLGIKHQELEVYLGLVFPGRLSGKILLDVEQNGEAYYINPDDLKGYFLGRPADAFEVMRELGLGIANKDLEQITPHKAEEPVTTQEENKEGDLGINKGTTVVYNTTLPKCTDQMFAVAPVALEDIVKITPLGSTNPPGHTIPTEHTYLHLNSPWHSSDMFTLYAVGDIYITTITSSDDGVSPGRDEYVIDFSLCKDVHGYYDHVKELAPEIQTLIQNVECEEWTVNPGNLCSKRIFQKIKAGMVLGKVGYVQGNFDLGTYDYRVMHDFINPGRYGSTEGEIGPLTLYKVCPYDYFSEPVRSELMAKFDTIGEPKCGEVMQDIPGTLQGNWFFGAANWGEPATWDQQLSLVHKNTEPSKQVISIGGTFTQAGVWEFTPKNSGTKNRRFSQVTVDNKIYCYEGIDPKIAVDPVKASQAKWLGRIIMQLIDDITLKIEHQEGSCTGNYKFIDPTIYNK